MAKKPKPTNELQDAIKFCSVANRDIGQPYQSHFIFGKGWLCAFDGIIAAAHPVKAGDVVCCPNAEMFRTAVAKSKGDLAMTISPDGDRISIVTGKLRANVPCIYSSEYPFFPPDPSVGTIDNRLRAAIITCGSLISENATRLHEAALLMRANSCVSTNGKSLFESWHGLNVPTLILPKALATVLEKIDKPLVSFGFSDKSLTLYFDNGAWIKAQLYDGAVRDYPNVDALISRLFPVTLKEIPADLFEAVDTVEKFAEVSAINLDANKIETESGDASYSIDLSQVVSTSCRVNPNFMLDVKWATHWAIVPDVDRKGFVLCFTGKVHGEPCRAIVMSYVNQPVQHRSPAFQAVELNKTAQDIDDEKVPF